MIYEGFVSHGIFLLSHCRLWSNRFERFLKQCKSCVSVVKVRPNVLMMNSNYSFKLHLIFLGVGKLSSCSNHRNTRVVTPKN